MAGERRVFASFFFVFSLVPVLCSCINWSTPIDQDALHDPYDDPQEGDVLAEAPDADAPDPETPEDGQDAACGQGESLCGGLCVNLMTDPAHCGACDSPCAEGEVCFDGTCGASCPEGLTDCFGACVDTAKDAEHCGACGAACPVPPNAVAVCMGGECAYACEPGWSDVNGLAEDGCEEECSFVSELEACNGVDDNCNGVIDEGFDCAMGRPTGCTTTCGSSGSGTCGIDCIIPEPAECAPPAETCNGVDDNCDGSPDDGFPCSVDEEVACVTDCGTDGTGLCTSLCAVPTGSECATTTAETCNGVDDNCNGVPDETFPCAAGLETDCTTACGSTGRGICTANCEPPPAAACTPPAELCNGADDDCDSTADEDFDCLMSTGSRSCGNCGTQSCTDSCTWGTCTDEGPCAPGAVQSCGVCGDQTCQSDCTWGTCSGGGECAPGATEPCGLCGTRTCSATCLWGACTGEGLCTPGAVQSCGYCGTQTCLSTCQWETCVGAGVCTPGSTQSCSVGSCPGTQTCSSSCAWGTCTLSGAVPSNDTCAGAIDVGSGGVFSGTTCGAANDYTATCAGLAGSPDVVYRLVVTELSEVTVSTCGGATWDTALYIKSGSCTGTQVACRDDYCGVQSMITAVLDPGTYYIIMDGYSSYNAGPFTLTVTVEPYVAPNDTCATALPLSFGSMTSGMTVGANHDYTGSCGGAGLDVVYTFTRSSASDVFIAAWSSDIDPVIYLSTTCGGSTSCNDNAYAGVSASALVLNNLSAGTYYLVVDSTSATPGTFTLEAYANGNAADGDQCGNPLRLQSGAAGNTTGKLNDYEPSCKNNDSTDDVYYFIVETTGTVTTNTCTGTSWDTILYYRDDCDTGGDLACNEDACDQGSQVSRSFSPGVYFLYVDGARSLTGPYTLTVSGL